MPAPEQIHTPRALLLHLLALLPDDAAASVALSAFYRSTDVDAWQAFVELAAIHGVLGILEPVLRRVDVPAATAVHLQRRAVVESMWHAQVRQALADAVTALTGAFIPVCALKGPALAARLYDTPAVRPSIDVDLLIRPGDLSRAIACLTSAGYHAEDDAVTREYLLRHSHHLSFSRAHQPGLEIHFHAYAGFGTVMPSGALMDRARPFEFDGASVLVPGAEDELVYLAVHAAGHSFIRLLWLYDLKQLIARAPALDWHAVVERARALQVSGPTTAALDLLRHWLNVDVPDVVLRAGPRVRPR
ncbi:MAG: nucleotidyltransferase family protein, partial [Acidobacteriaceae bacterium]|nr:nucleotidyltransferase family protein [Acidobacteriaceae bacterium]